MQAYDTLSFACTLVDIYDRPIPNEKVVAVVLANGTQLRKETYSDKNGRYGFYFDNMPTCSRYNAGDYERKRSNFGTPYDEWDIWFTTYKPGIVIQAFGSTFQAERNYIQICDEEIVR